MRLLNVSGRLWAVFMLSSLSAVAGAATVAEARPAPPKVPTSFETAAHNLAVKPSSILVSQDGNGSVWGPNSRGFKGENHFPREPSIRWSRWTSREALGTGSLIQGNCTPSCAQGTFTAYPVSIKMWRAAVFHGESIFTRFSFTFTSERPSGFRRSVISTATYRPATTAYGGSPAYWGWNPTF
jgi:hypothetical protein